MYVKWTADSGSHTKYHRISRSECDVELDAKTKLMTTRIPGAPLLTQCGQLVPSQHIGALGLSLQDFNGGLCEFCIQANGF